MFSNRVSAWKESNRLDIMERETDKAGKVFTV